MNSSEWNYKYDFSEEEQISIECWYDIVVLFRSVQWEQTDNAILGNKQYVINCLAELMCELDNFKEQFEKIQHTNYLDDLRNALVKLMSSVGKKISDDDAPIFFGNVYDIFKKAARIEE
ncbi:hypothetical protein [Staphylococcus equorum]|uniref:hypothetical protein n=1 Tax=Staphylococcus equorum TaxID=246432 RepID=UPI003F564F0D